MILERLRSIEVCDVIAMIACTRSDVLGLLTEPPVLLGVGDELPDCETLHCEQSGLNISGMARNVIFALSKTAA